MWEKEDSKKDDNKKSEYKYYCGKNHDGKDDCKYDRG